ncbi:MAG: HAMP domain-containing sensor histidine kinase [Campylobacterota bacterium]|nr:HAMP domain-containing sensor histidine kinase [Campylobacterota bacterium]
MSKKIKNFIIITILFIVANGVAYYITQFNQEKRIEIILDKHSQTLQTYYEILKYNQHNSADIAYEETINNKRLLELLSKANSFKNSNDIKSLNRVRDEVKNLLTLKYKEYKKRGILQYHFVFPDNKVFLRMHKINKYGDDLTHIRSDFKYVNEYKKSIRGFAQGRTAHAFRNVYPIVDKDNNYLGAFEVSFSSELIQEYFTHIKQLHTHFLVNKNIFESKTWDRDDLVLKYTPSAEHKDYMLTLTAQHSKQKCIINNAKKLESLKNNIDLMMLKNEQFSLFKIFNKKSQIISFYPIKHNITKKPVAWIVSYSYDNAIKKAVENTFYVRIFSVVVFLLLFGFIYFILNQKEILNQMVDEKTKSLSNINRELEESEHELQLINENLEKKINKEVQKNREKDKALFEHTKMAALGEMIANIAHQWRQPLSAISTNITAMQLKKELGMLEDDEFVKGSEMINENVQYLSRTIDDFRNFIRGNSKKENFNLKDAINTFINLTSSYIKHESINMEIKVDKDIYVTTLKNELNQSLLNLFNNSKDALSDKEYDKYIYMDASIKNEMLIINFKDNAGGIDENIMDKIFEPYFTTKHQSQGTGLGLNMTYRLISEGMKGTISVSNEIINYKGIEYKGATFTITIPLN